MDLEKITEIVNAFSQLVTPVVIVVIGYFISQRLKNIDEAIWLNRKVIEKRLEVVERISPKINDVFVFFRWVGDWKEISPEDVLAAKRFIDKEIHVNRYLLSENFISSYEKFSSALFLTYSGYGRDAKIRSEISGIHGDRERHGRFDWDPKFFEMFEESGIASEGYIDMLYNDLVLEFKTMLAVPRQ